MDRLPDSILLVGPYPGDRLESIERYTACLQREVSRHTRVKVISPRPRLGRFGRDAAGKWLGYVDKFLLFPKVLKAELRHRASLVHLCDQTAAPHIRHLRNIPHLLTCFDFIAIRSARGEFPAHPTRWSGRRLQSMILRGISGAERVSCISEATRRDLLRLIQREPETVTTNYLGLHTTFRRLEPSEIRPVLKRVIPDEPYILHVGGNQWYKNRNGVLRIFREVIQSVPGPLNLVLVGKSLVREQNDFIFRNGLESRVFSAPHCSDADLMAFYSGAKLLLFPSLTEGFGWPVVEAQACGCPVVTSRTAPLAEIGGESAVLIDPLDEDAAGKAVCNLLSWSEDMIANNRALGFENARRFSTEQMISGYLNLYRKSGRSRAGGIPQVN